MSMQQVRSLMDITKKIAIYGKSGHGKVLADMARLLGYTEIIWVDDDESKGAYSFLVYLEFYHTIPIALGIGDNITRQKLAQKLLQHHVTLATLVHPRAVVSPSAEVAKGSVIMANAVVNADTVIGQGVIVNSGSVVEHDNVIEDFVHISPNAALGGGVRVKKLSHIGIGASVIQGKCIGENTIVGAGSVVITDIPANVTAVGVPARVKQR